MKKTKLFAALCLAAALACGLMLGACSSAEDPTETIKADLAAQFDPYKNLDETVLNELVTSINEDGDLDTFGIDGLEYVTSMLGGFNYDITDVALSEDGQSATVTATLTCKSFNDISAATEEIITALADSGELAEMSMDELNKKAGEAMMQALNEAEVKTTECTFEHSLVDGTWTIGDSAETQIYNAFFA